MSHGQAWTRERAKGALDVIMQTALDAVDPAEAVRRCLRLVGDQLVVGSKSFALSRLGRLVVVGAGKAGAPMVRAVEEIVGDRIDDGLVIVKAGHALPTERVALVEAGHPIPDRRGLDGARCIEGLISGLDVDDLVLCLISGGGSALATYPMEGITLADLQSTTDALLHVGATINEVNAVRKHLERLKGGGLARLAFPAQVASLILSDVVGDPLDVIASGPTVPDTTTYADAWAVLERYELEETVPASVRRTLQAGMAGNLAETLKPGDPASGKVHHVVVGSNALAADAAARAAEQQGFHVLVLTTFLQGEAREVARVLASFAKELAQRGGPLKRPACLILGGETTVTVRGSGKGGRNQEMALAAAVAVAGVPNVLIACLATDGTDGPTDAAGAIVDGDTAAQAHRAGLDPLAYLAANDAYRFLDALDLLLRTGPTRTNVNDLAFVLAW
ncbi:MAG: glycerate kinase type-2 family protein [Anaerolineae bacterium]